METIMAKPMAVRKSKAFVLKHPYAVLVLLAAITLLLGWQLPYLSFQTTIYDLIIEDLPENTQYRHFKEIFGSDEIIRVVARTDYVFSRETFQALTDLSERFAKIEGIRRVISLPGVRKDVELAKDRSLEEFAEILQVVSLFEKNILSPDRKSTILTLVLDPARDKERIIADIEGELDKHQEIGRMYQIGIPLVSEAMVKYVRRDFFSLPPVTLVLIVILLWLFFGNLRCLLLPVACVGLTLVWTFGLMALSGVALSMVTMIIPVFIIALGTAYCLHVLSEYMNLAQDAATPEAAVSLAFSHVTMPLVLAVVTTIIGIGSLLINRITAIREFSIFACFGMFSLMLILLTFFPIILAWMKPLERRNRHARIVERGLSAFLKGLIQVNLRHRGVSMAIICAISLFCAFGISRIRVETTPVDFFRSNVPVYQHFHDIYQDMSGSFPAHVVLKGTGDDFFEQPENIAAMAKFQTYLDTLNGVDKTVSFADYLKLVNYATHRFEKEYYRLPEEDFEVRRLMNSFESLLGTDVLRAFVDRSMSRTNVLLLTHISSSQDFLALGRMIEKHAQDEFSGNFSVDVTGLGMVISASSDLITTGQIKSLALSLVVVFVIMVMLFLSTKVGLIALLPNLFPILVSFGLMGWLGIKLSMATSLIAGIAIGLAVDDTIHYLVRYNREFRKDLNKDRALRDTVFGVGRPVVLTTVIISVGFSVLMFSHFQPTAVFGGLMIITMVSALIGDLILLPTLLLQVELVTAWDLLKLIPSVSGLSSGFVHEMNQPLTTIKMGSEFLKRMAKQGEAPPKEQLAEVAEEISSQVDRAAELMHRFSKFAETSDQFLEEVDINDTVKSSLAIIENQLKLDNITVETEFGPTLPTVPARRNLLVQAIFNLITNAAEAIIADGDRPENPRRLDVRTSFQNRRVEVTIADTGPGIPESYKNRVFEPFFTTKEVGQGKGLGLSITRQILRDFGGTIRLDSNPGKGTTATLTFPVDVEQTDNSEG